MAYHKPKHNDFYSSFATLTEAFGQSELVEPVEEPPVEPLIKDTISIVTKPLVINDFIDIDTEHLIDRILLNVEKPE